MSENAPGPEVLTQEDLSRLLSEHLFGALATNNSGGHPQLSTVLYQWDPAERVARVSSTAGRLKVRQLRRDPRAALYLSTRDHTTYVVAEATAEIAATTEPGDAAGRELLAMTPGIDDPEEREAFLRRQVDEERVVIRLRVHRLYGMALDLPPALRDA
ncbi:TIGR03618 family F420-dependent PPOX class oxidoreductase [Actinomadura viridis]|uniref:PPOX class probable F420-dependent enzyme n=1 Tax=Actinomadura viridis TaxID=58110 RepID=A0A931DPC2_9ACTN|nr:TIGR03618 family F420-dependent PPOX class oxidoreductase [Actinomadura viridis]MBG6093337.1 PPOX class probable F420-dependent enzyme [Actinomadura viridis]